MVAVFSSARAHDSTALRIPLLAQGHHLLHVLHRDHRVAGLTEKNAGTVSEINYCVAHDFRALLPLASHRVALLVAGGADLDDSIRSARVGIHSLRRYVHQPDVVGAVVAYHLRLEIVQPVGICASQTGPFVARSLR
jgi:hypothetical protein